MNFANVSITETGRGYEIQFEFRKTILEEIKAMPGNRFFGKEKGWFVPYFHVKKTEGKPDEEFHNRPALEKFKKKYLVVTAGSDEPEKFFKINELPELKIPLPWKAGTIPYPFQNNCIARGLELKRFINAAQPGLGKSLMAIGTVLGFQVQGQNPYPCLVICPSTLKENWRREIEDKFTNRRAVVLSDKTRDNWHQLHRMGIGDFIIVNYESLWSHFVVGTTNKPGTNPQVKDMKFTPLIGMFKSVIIDEFHKLKDMTTRAAKVAKGVTTGKEIIIGLTGTPVVNKPKDLVSQLAILNQLSNLGGYKYFLDRYCAGGAGASNLSELNGKLNNICFFRKEKKDVLKDLPDKLHEVFTCDISTQAEYNACSKDIGKYLREQGYSEKQVNKSLNAEMMVKIGKLKAISALGKIPEAIEHIQEVVDAGEKIVVFIHSKAVADILIKHFPGAVSVRGKEIDPITQKERPQSAAARQQAVDSFQQCAICKVKQEEHGKIADHDFKGNDVNVIVVSINAGGVGITLTAASRLIFIELPWHPASVEQCSDRIHRITQKNACQIGFFLGKGTIDEQIYKMIEKKRKVSDAITGTTTTIDTIIQDLTRSLFNQR